MIEQFTKEFLEAAFDTGVIRNEDVILVGHGDNERRFTYPIGYAAMAGLISIAGNETFPDKVKKIANVCTMYAKDIPEANTLLGFCTTILKRPIYETTEHKAAATKIANDMINPPSKFKSFRDKLAELPQHRQDHIIAEADKMLEALNRFSSLEELSPQHLAQAFAEDVVASASMVNDYIDNPGFRHDTLAYGIMALIDAKEAMRAEVNMFRDLLKERTAERDELQQKEFFTKLTACHKCGGTGRFVEGFEDNSSYYISAFRCTSTECNHMWGMPDGISYTTEGAEPIGVRCDKCGGACGPAKAFVNDIVKMPTQVHDFPSDDMEKEYPGQTVTLSTSTEAELVACLKCKKCGHSFIPERGNDD